MRRADASLVYELFSPLSEFGQLEVRCDRFTVNAEQNWIKTDCHAHVTED